MLLENNSRLPLNSQSIGFMNKGISERYPDPSWLDIPRPAGFASREQLDYVHSLSPLRFHSLFHKIIRAVLLGRPFRIICFIADFVEAEITKRTLGELECGCYLLKTTKPDIYPTESCKQLMREETYTENFSEGVIPEYDIQLPALDRYRDFDAGEFQFETAPDVQDGENFAVCDIPDVSDLEEGKFDTDEFTQGPITEYDITSPAVDRYREYDLDAYRIENEEYCDNEQKECVWLQVEQRDSSLNTRVCKDEQNEYSGTLLEQRDSHQLLPESKEGEKKALEHRDYVRDSDAFYVESKEYSGTLLEQRDSRQYMPESREYAGMALEQRDSTYDSARLPSESKEYSGEQLEQRDSVASLPVGNVDIPCHDDADVANPDTEAIDIGRRPSHSVRCNCTFCRYFASLSAVR